MKLKELEALGLLAGEVRYVDHKGHPLEYSPERHLWAPYGEWSEDALTEEDLGNAQVLRIEAVSYCRLKVKLNV